MASTSANSLTSNGIGFSSVVLSRLCVHNTAMIMPKAEALLKRITPHQDKLGNDTRVGLPAFCAYLASERLNLGPSARISIESAISESGLTPADFDRGLKRALDILLLPSSEPLKLVIPQTAPPQRPQPPSHASASSGQHKYLYHDNILEPLFTQKAPAVTAQSHSISEKVPSTKRKRREDTEDTTDRVSLLEKELIAARSETDHLRRLTKKWEDETTRLHHKNTSLQHLIERERFAREERDINEHNELTALRATLLSFQPVLPPSAASSQIPFSSTSAEQCITSISDAIAVVEAMSRRRLIITDLPNVETYETAVEPQPMERTGSPQPSRSNINATPNATTTPRCKSKQKSLVNPGVATMATLDQPPEEGTMVWARTTGFPWYPAVTHEKGPTEVMKSKPKPKNTLSDPQHVLVNYFDTRQSWGWIPLNNLRMFAFDEELDKDMVSAKSYMQSTKWTVIERAKVTAAYHTALLQMAPEND